jgi:outer membrane protein insertion porin family
MSANVSDRRPSPLALALLLCFAGGAGAQTPPPSPPSSATTVSPADSFIVADIRVDGLQRIGAGTVFTYLPIERGDTVDSARIGEAMRALYKTGFFEDIRIDRDVVDSTAADAKSADPKGNVAGQTILVVTVTERPAINTITLTGNKDIKTEDLLKNLKDIGISEGETFDMLAMNRVTLELNRAYNNRGKYYVEIVPKVERLGRNRVDVAINVKEGKAARIRHINLTGNEKFDEDDIRKRWESNESNWLSWYRRDDQYSREKLSGDLETLNNFYLDRGYVDFSVDHTQVAIGPDKKDMYITAGITEGEIYTVAAVNTSGDTVLSQEQLQKYLLVKEGQTFSRAFLEFSSDSIVAALGNIGYAFARVNPVPEVDREKRTVAINLQVLPGPRVSVRRIQFKGNTRTTDEVLRREMRQFEGAWYSQAAVDRSKVRLQRLGYFETGSVEAETVPVAGSDDLVDVIFNVKETSSGQFQVGLGYSQESGANISFQISQRNFLGSGRGFSINAIRNDTTYQAGFSITEPYFEDSGIGLGYAFSTARTRQTDDDESSYDSDQSRANVTLSLPLSESNSIEIVTGWERQTLFLSDGYYPQSSIDYLDALGSDDRIDTWKLSASWSSDTRNDFLTPTAGAFQSIGVELALPGSTAQYYKFDYRYGRYWPIGPINLFARAELGYGDSYGSVPTRTVYVDDTINDPDTLPDARLVRAEGLPFYENFYAGGGRSLRTFRDNSLGPCEFVAAYDDCQPTGGSLKTIGSLELSVPGLFGGRASGTRVAMFLDVGNVFDGVDNFDTGELRASAGLTLLWRSPMGPISISYGTPLLKKEGDDIERLQFSFGGQF